MDEMDYFEREEFIFSEEGGVTGTRAIRCPHCSKEHELEVQVGNQSDAYQCSHCHKDFMVNWNTGRVRSDP